MGDKGRKKKPVANGQATRPLAGMVTARDLATRFAEAERALEAGNAALDAARELRDAMQSTRDKAMKALLPLLGIGNWFILIDKETAVRILWSGGSYASAYLIDAGTMEHGPAGSDSQAAGGTL